VLLRWAEELLNYQGCRLVAFVSCPHQKEQEAREPIAVKAVWRARDLIDVAWDKLAEAWDWLVSRT
jgi:hypothetical protein